MGSTGFVISDNPKPTAGGWTVSDSAIAPKPIDNGIPSGGSTGPIGFQSSYVTPHGGGPLGNQPALHHRIPLGTPTMGGPVMPLDAMIPTAIATGLSNIDEWTKGPPSTRQIGPHGIPPGTPIMGGPVIPRPTGAFTGNAEVQLPPDTPRFQAPKLSPSVRALGDPSVVRAAIKVIPKGDAVLKAHDLYREALSKAKAGTPAPTSWTGNAPASGPIEPIPAGTTPSTWTGSPQPQVAPVPGTLQTTIDPRALEAVTPYAGGPIPQGTGMPSKPVPLGPMVSTLDPRAIQPNTVPSGPIVQGTGIPTPTRPLSNTFDPRAIEANPAVNGTPQPLKVNSTTFATGATNPGKITPIHAESIMDNIADIHPDDLEASASLLTNGKKAFADLKGTTRTEAIQRARQFSSNRPGLQPIAAQPAINPVAPNLQTEILPKALTPPIGTAPANEPIATPIPLAGTEGTQSTIGSVEGHVDDATAKIHNLYDYLATQRPDLKPADLEKIASDKDTTQGLKLARDASEWARSQGRTEGTLGNPNSPGYSSFDFVNKRRGGRGTVAEVIDMLKGKAVDPAHARPENYGSLPESPHVAQPIKAIR